MDCQLEDNRRCSNLELYRIVVMLLIVAHHYVVLSGLTYVGMPLREDPLAENSVFLWLLGMWGKAGINCFVLITGYFMCTRNITSRKFLKLYLWIMNYRIVLAVVFVMKGDEVLSHETLLRFLPFYEIHTDNFPSSFMAWWLFIPFLNVLVNNMTMRQHVLLVALMVLVFSVFRSVPGVLYIKDNPICWFSTLYIVSSFIRRYPERVYRVDSVRFWCVTSIFLIIVGMISVVALLWLHVEMGLPMAPFFMVADSDKPLALMIAVATFLWFKNIKVRYSRIINILGGASFGVLLIHSDSHAMMNWLWKDVVDCVGHYNMPLWMLVGYSTLVVVCIYMICAAIDYIRLKTFEEPFFRWYDGISMK